jgi:hypothetical protein
MREHPTGTTGKERVSGVSETRGGESIGLHEGEPGHRPAGTTGAGRPAATPDARRSTGINPKAENPIDPSMPPLFPA